MTAATAGIPDSRKGTSGGFFLCPVCGNDRRSVLDSRRNPDGIRRRCVCLACQVRYTTQESVATEYGPLDWSI